MIYLWNRKYSTLETHNNIHSIHNINIKKINHKNNIKNNFDHVNNILKKIQHDLHNHENHMNDEHDVYKQLTNIVLDHEDKHVKELERLNMDGKKYILANQMCIWIFFFFFNSFLGLRGGDLWR